MPGITVMLLPVNPPPPMKMLSGTLHVMLYKPPGGPTLHVRDTTPEGSLSSVTLTSDGAAKEGGRGRRGVSNQYAHNYNKPHIRAHT